MPASPPCSTVLNTSRAAGSRPRHAPSSARFATPRGSATNGHPARAARARPPGPAGPRTRVGSPIGCSTTGSECLLVDRWIGDCARGIRCPTLEPEHEHRTPRRSTRVSHRLVWRAGAADRGPSRSPCRSRRLAVVPVVGYAARGVRGLAAPRVSRDTSVGRRTLRASGSVRHGAGDPHVGAAPNARRVCVARQPAGALR